MIIGEDLSGHHVMIAGQTVTLASKTGHVLYETLVDA